MRERAHGGLEALAPDLPPPARAGAVADWLLGQGARAEPARRSSAAVGGDRRGAAARRGRRDRARAVVGLEPAPAASARRGRPAIAAPPPRLRPPLRRPTRRLAPASPGRSSRLGGAILIAVAVLVVGGVLAFVLTRGGDDKTAGTGTPAPTAAATGTPQAQAGDIVLRGPAGSKAVGLMRLFRANDDTVRFALAAQDVAPNKGNQTYSIWFRKKNGAAIRLGVAQNPVGTDRTLTTAGPRNEDVGKFPQWFATYDTVIVSRDASPTAKKPGIVILSGDLPHASG